jgi:hypothetical protein
MEPIINDLNIIYPNDYYAVLLDGKVIGFLFKI